MPATENIAKRLEPTHLLETTENLKAEVAEQVKNDPKKPEPEKSDPRQELEYTFNFSWTDGRKKLWEGKFTNKILTIRERQLVGAMRARLSGGVVAEALDVTTNEINLMVAHMAYSLVDKKPDWAEDFLVLTDPKLLYQLYQEVLDHEGYFLGYREVEDSSAE